MLPEDATWIYYGQYKRDYPTFYLEGKVISQREDKIDMIDN